MEDEDIAPNIHTADPLVRYETVSLVLSHNAIGQIYCQSHIAYSHKEGSHKKS